MSNTKSPNELPKVAKVAQNSNEPSSNEKQQGVKRPFTSPQSPLKIEQQRRNEAFGSNVSDINLHLFNE